MNYRVFLVAVVLSFSELNAQTNRALFVGIDSYPEDSGWNKIHATNDTLLVLPMLKRHQFLRTNIKLLINEQATKEAIVKSLVNLEEQTSLGDHLYIHFSCHGQQMLDDNGDELDGLDEAIIPFDAKRRFETGKYEGRNHLRDDELGNLMEALRVKAGRTGVVNLVIDACHSGTGTRSDDEDVYTRGTTYIFAPENNSLFLDNFSNWNLGMKNDKNLSVICVFSACNPSEINYEYLNEKGEYYGSLSYSFCKVMDSYPYFRSISNYDFAKKVESEMRKIFARKKWKQIPYFESTNSKKQFKFSL